MKKQDLIDQWVASIQSGTFLPVKHDPNHLSTLRQRRSVVSHEVSASLEPFIISGNFFVNEYINTNPRHTTPYYELLPYSGSFNNIGGKAESNTPFTSSKCDRLIIVSGSQSGWHTFTEDASGLQDKLNSGELVYSGSLQ